MRRCGLLLLLAGALWAQDFSGARCGRVMTDTGCFLVNWAMCSYWKSAMRKTLRVQVPVREIVRAAVEYEVMLNPADPEAKRRNISDPGYPWGNWQIRVNGTLVLDKPAGPYITKGAHCIEIPAGVLKQGPNHIEIGWAKDSTRCGQVYFSCDAREEEKNMGWRERLKRNPNGLRIRLLLELR